ncbi:NosR/NirI family protein [Paracoccus aerodenitrificans]|uniref:NosR/NirI family protein n=1 Tax=Paracoccus aerodenitrificans TaxID=3017781 RepID=UPI0022F0AE18|nr:NosR/NirI family protein [Paracoccus aerodenitrificans]WBU62783.1 4Fe-4S binding protein [Paracoccus aerodenitrificans]
MRIRVSNWLKAAAFAVLAMFAGPFDGNAQPRVNQSAPGIGVARLTAEQAAALFGLGTDFPRLIRQDSPVPGWTVSLNGQDIGMIGSTWELTGSTGYSGKPLDVLVAVTPEGLIAGAELIRQSEPVLTLGISETDIAAYIDGFGGVDLIRPDDATPGRDPDLPDVISRATVSTGVIRDGILRTGRVLAQAQGLGQGAIDRVSYAPADWRGLVAMGAFGHSTLTMAQAAQRFAAAKNPVTPSDAPFIDLYAGLIDTPMIGRNLLGQEEFTALTGPLRPDEALLAVMSQGLHSHRGTAYRQSGMFDRIEFVQGNLRIRPTVEQATAITEIALSDAPDFREISVFRVNADPNTGGIDPGRPFDVVVTASRPSLSGDEILLEVAATVSLPPEFLNQPAEPAPLWIEFWMEKQPGIAIVAAMLAVLGLILFGQEWLVRRKRLWRVTRIGFLTATLFVLGWGINGQLSVVQVVAFLNALLSGFRWESFLIEPIIFLLWSAVALGLLFWGRGVFCGWLCPFGALQELTNNLAQQLGLRQIAVPQALHERLWVIKYTLFVAIVALSFYSMEKALILAEAEPFKTAISMRFMRAWPFLLFVAAILIAGLFIERFYCRYICPLGAGLAIPAKLKVFDWLKRRPQCGRECRLCETRCTVGAIDPLGRINQNECVLCLRCQVIMNDSETCPVLKRRARKSPQASNTLTQSTRSEMAT